MPSRGYEEVIVLAYKTLSSFLVWDKIYSLFPFMVILWFSEQYDWLSYWHFNKSEFQDQVQSMAIGSVLKSNFGLRQI